MILKEVRNNETFTTVKTGISFIKVTTNGRLVRCKRLGCSTIFHLDESMEVTLNEA